VFQNHPSNEPAACVAEVTAAMTKAVSVSAPAPTPCSATSWIDRLTPAEVLQLDDFDARLLLDELSWRRDRMTDLQQARSVAMAASVFEFSSARDETARAYASGVAEGVAEAARRIVLGVEDKLVAAVTEHLRGVTARDDSAVVGPATSRHQHGTPVTEASILSDVALVERVTRRLRRFVKGLVNRTLEIAPPLAVPTIDDPTRAHARRLLARSGFMRVR
jgi:hypothetical protein